MATKIIKLYDVNCIGEFFRNGLKVKPSMRKDQCLTVRINDKTTYLHRLVAQKYISNPNQKKTVNHKDGNRLNNKVTNLEWLTISENLEHARVNKLWGKNIVEKRKLTDEQVTEIKKKYIPKVYSIKRLANEYEVDYKTMWNVINNISYQKNREDYV
jgi:hypothetical protein